MTELAEERYVGSALTLQTTLGYLLTTVSLQLIPVVQNVVGWQWGFAPLAGGPALGTVAMLALRRLPAANELASGKK